MMHMHVRTAPSGLGWNGWLHSYEITSFAKYGATAVFVLDTMLLVNAGGDSTQTEIKQCNK